MLDVLWLRMFTQMQLLSSRDDDVKMQLSNIIIVN